MLWAPAALPGTAVPCRQSGQVTSEQKKTLALGSLTLSGPPAAWCVTHWGSPGASAEVLGTLHRQSGGEGTRVGGLCWGVMLSPVSQLHLLCLSNSGWHHLLVPSSSLGLPVCGRVGACPHLASVARAEAGWAPSSSGHLGMGAASMTAATVTVTPTASIRCPSAAPHSTAMCPGTARPAPPPSPPRTAVATRMRSRL